nr:rod shape-determining protein MreD [Eubacterium sp.]
MIKKKIVVFFVIIISFLLQTTIFRNFELANVVPNFLLIVTVSYGYLRGRTSGLLIGFFCGLLLDLYCGSVIGLYAFIFMSIGFLLGYCQKFIFTDTLWLPAVLISISDLLYGIYYYVVEFLMRGRIQFGYYFSRVILPEII